MEMTLRVRGHETLKTVSISRPRSLETRTGRGFPHSHSNRDYWRPISQNAESRQNRGLFQIPAQNLIFNYHANMVLIPGNGSGFILLENIYSGPDERRLNQIADGVALLLTGKDPPPVASTARLELAYGVLLLIFFVQVWVVVRVARRLTSHHARPPVRPTVLGVSMLVLAILLSLSWGLLIVFGIPRLFGMPLITTVVRVPDFGYVLLMCAFLAFSTSILKGLVGLSFFSNVRQVHRHLPSCII